ncbi:6-pyruvoyl trahydropterin synthase family protein [Albimonas pacifica]|uniref:6-carboxy-5,6,7,8-tetrahydropterin synthase n=1 Tax=Albimonas pacifica TaxID=1114924 RepID=A0A1I3H223_9RHOB|nr:6-carboxytetrahydropterin synthase [Albimonas pacifica]SFI29805.1 6-pyruvoyl-tetrahydropterin synthase [Albimonas pacifica]
MYAVEVRDHVMLAHSLPGEVFGPAQGLHGATYVVDVAFYRAELGPERIVVDIGRAHEALKAALAPLNYANLDETFPGELTTTEWLAKHVHDQLSAAARAGGLGVGSEGIERIRVTLNESHVARAWYEAAP